MAVLVKIAGLVARMIMMGTRLFRNGFVAVAMFVQITGSMPRMIVMRSWLFLCHGMFLSAHRLARKRWSPGFVPALQGAVRVEQHLSCCG